MLASIDTFIHGSSCALTLTLAIGAVGVIIVIAAVTAIISKTKKD